MKSCARGKPTWSNRQMACPRCGGEDRKLVAPGYFECTSLMPVMQGLTPAGVPVPGSASCGHRYQEGAPVSATGTCTCRTFAIGTCGQCGRPICGDHSRLADDERVCVTCLQARAEQARDVVASSHAEVIAGLKAVADPLERLLRTAWYVDATYNSGAGQGATGAGVDDLYEVFPEFTAAPSGRIRLDRPVRKAPKDHWDTAASGRWFVSTAARRGMRPPDKISVVTIKERRFSTPVITGEQVLPCWNFGAHVLPDGRVVRGEVNLLRGMSLVQFSLNQFTDLHPAELDLDALAYMAAALGLKTSQPGLPARAGRVWRRQ